jgi:hypothetical protein
MGSALAVGSGATVVTVSGVNGPGGGTGTRDVATGGAAEVVGA